MYYSSFETDICRLTLVGDEQGLKRIHLKNKSSDKVLRIEASWIENDDFFSQARKQLLAYFKGELKTFSLKLNPDGTEYQKRVWKALQTIPYGQTRSYKEIAIMTGNEKASRAVGMANGKNPLPIVVPCHRVIGSNGKLTGFAFGLELKKDIINLEKEGLSV